jgi:hypothetical protein
MKTCCEMNPAACTLNSFSAIWARLACLWRNTLSKMG